MGFIDRELARIETALHQPQPSERYASLYAAQQALKWATEPQGFAAPLDVIERGAVQPPTGTPAGTADYLAAGHLAPS